MARNSGPTPPDVTQAEPTRPWPLDEAGRPIDRWGLPLNGPARADALAERGIADPALADAAAEPAPATPPAPPAEQE